MDKIYDALRKLSSKSSKAQNTNSEYFVIGMLRVRVSDHTSNEMACHSNHLYVLTHNNRKNLYTVCWGRTVQLCTYSEVLLLLKTAKKFNSTLSTLLNVPEENKIDDREVASWSANINNDQFLIDNGFDVSRLTNREKKKVRIAFAISGASLQERKNAMKKELSDTIDARFRETKSTLMKLKTSDRIDKLIENNMSKQRKVYFGWLIEQASSFSDLRNIVNKAKVYTNKQ